MRLSILILLLFAITGCQKDRFELDDYQYIVGTYEWVHSYSMDGSMESESQQTITDKYAYLIKLNGKVNVYKNGERVNKGYVTGIDDRYPPSIRVYIHFEDNSTGYAGELKNDIFTVESYPIVDSQNEYQKVL